MGALLSEVSKESIMIAFVVLICVGMCLGQSVDPVDIQAEAKKYFDIEDRDHDGFITKTEMYQQFMTYDSNGDGKISRHEYTETICRLAPQMYGVSHYMYDTYELNHDHTLDTPDIDMIFPIIDTYSDGKVDFNEYLENLKKSAQTLQNLGTHQQTHNHGHSQCH